MLVKTSFDITEDLTASLTDNNYLLTIYSKEKDDYDTYKLENGEWVMNYDSLSNSYNINIWENNIEFTNWAEYMKKFAKE